MKEYAPGIRSSELSLVDTRTTPGREAAVPEPAPLPGAEGAPSEGSEDRFLAKARDEHAKGHVDPALWGRAVAQAGSDKALATRIYLDTRATALRVAKRQERAARRAQVVDVLSKAPDPGFETVTPAAGDATPLKGSGPARRGSARAKRKLTILASGVLASTVAIVGVVALWPASGPAQEPNVAKAAFVNLTKRAASAAQNASASTNTGKATEPTGDDVVSKVQALEKDGNWNLLVIYTVEWTRKQPFNPEAWKTLSMGYVKLRQFSEAIDAASKATQLAPEDFRLWQNLGQINLAVPRPAEALTAFQRATALNDKDIVSLAQEGTLNIQLGHLAEAKTAFDKALALSPDDVPALCGVAALAQKEGRVKDAEAMTLQIASRDARCPVPNEGETVRVAANAPAARVPAVSATAASVSAPGKPRPLPARRPQ